MSHLLVTNDFPPKHGGIQSYLWELWRRVDPATFAVLTSQHQGSAAWDATQPFRIERIGRGRLLVPTPALGRYIDDLARQIGARLVMLDPVLPLGLVARHLSLPYGLVLHGAEVTAPGRLPGTRHAMAHVLRGAEAIIAAGDYPAAEAERSAGRRLPVTVVAPGVDTVRFQPIDDDMRAKVRAEFGIPTDARVVLSVSRLVPRKGMDVLIRAAARLAPSRPDLVVAIAGAGRDRARLEWLADRLRAPVRLLGRVSDEELPDVFGAADIFAMMCRNRWAGLEQEGFGIVFLEAAACGVPQVAGSSGGAADAVADGETGVVVREPRDGRAVARVLGNLLDDPDRRAQMGSAARHRAVGQFDYDVLAARLRKVLSGYDGPA